MHGGSDTSNAATRSMKEILSAVGAKETDQTVLLSIGNEIIKLQILD
jgi:ribosomal protein L4